MDGRLQRWAISDGGHRMPFPAELEGEGITQGRSWEGKGRGVTEGRFPEQARGLDEDGWRRRRDGRVSCHDED